MDVKTSLLLSACHMLHFLNITHSGVIRTALMQKDNHFIRQSWWLLSLTSNYSSLNDICSNCFCVIYELRDLVSFYSVFIQHVKVSEMPCVDFKKKLFEV